MKKLISIVIPTRNSEKYIDDTIFSIKEQSYKNIEIIFIDYYSKDKTIEIIKNSNLSNFKIIQTHSKGVPLALNLGLSSSRGEILTWLNSDDTYTSNESLQKISDHFHDNVDLVYGNCLLMNQYGMIIDNILSCQIDYLDYINGANLSTGAAFFSKKAWDKFGGFSDKYKIIFEYEIFDFIFKYYNVLYIDEYIQNLRIHPKSLTSLSSNIITKEISDMRPHLNKTGKVKRFYLNFKLYLKSKQIFKRIITKIKNNYKGKNFKYFFKTTVYKKNT